MPSEVTREAIARIILRLAFQETERAIDACEGGNLWPWQNACAAADAILALTQPPEGKAVPTEAVSKLRRAFRKTRLTPDVGVDANDLSDVLDYFRALSTPTPKAEGGEPNNLRNLVTRFFDLKLSEKREIAQTFGLLLPDEWTLPAHERWKASLIEAKRRGILDAVADMVAGYEGETSGHAEGAYDLNAALAERLADPEWLAKWNAADEDATPFWKLLNALRADEGDSVTLLSDNPDFNGQPSNAIECNGAWTDWKDRRFTGDTLRAAVLAAYRARHAEGAK